MSGDPFPASLVLVGAGKMGGALLEGWLALGFEPGRLRVRDPQPSAALLRRAAEAGFGLNAAIDAAPEVLVLAVKPQMLDAAAPSLTPLVGPSTLVLSILAGKTIADLESRLPAARAIVRAMPNLPASVGRGISGAVASPGASAAQRAVAGRLLGAVGAVEWLEDERLVDAVTAVSGSGPAYVFYLTECLAAAAIEIGLAPDLAARLARATVEGAGELMTREAATPPSTLRQNVTSPGGTTAAALEILMAADGLDPLLRRAVVAALQRARALSG